VSKKGVAPLVLSFSKRKAFKAAWNGPSLSGRIVFMS
jgi:hypothetical protein